MNHLHEGMPELVTREDAIEAAEYWHHRHDVAVRHHMAQLTRMTTRLMDAILTPPPGYDE